MLLGSPPPIRCGQPGGVGCMPAILAVMFMLLFMLTLVAVVVYGMKDVL